MLNQKFSEERNSSAPVSASRVRAWLRSLQHPGRLLAAWTESSGPSVRFPQTCRTSGRSVEIEKCGLFLLQGRVSRQLSLLAFSARISYAAWADSLSHLFTSLVSNFYEGVGFGLFDFSQRLFSRTGVGIEFGKIRFFFSLSFLRISVPFVNMRHCRQGSQSSQRNLPVPGCSRDTAQKNGPAIAP